jgi:CRP-like cAMP-binding protein
MQQGAKHMARTSCWNGAGTLLANSPIFGECPPDEMDALDGLTTLTNVRLGSTLMRQGGYDGQFVIVLDGVANVTRDGVDIAEIGPGECVGEIGLLFDRPRTATVVARTPIKGLVFNQVEFRTMMRECDRMHQQIERLATSRMQRIGTAA